jgi:hypothetical protein
VDLWLQPLEDWRNGRAVKEADPVHHPQVREDLHPFGFRDDRSQLALAQLNREIGVDRCHQPVSAGVSGRQIAQVPDVEDVKRTVDQDHGQPLLPPSVTFLGELVE